MSLNEDLYNTILYQSFLSIGTLQMTSNIQMAAGLVALLVPGIILHDSATCLGSFSS